MALICPGMSGYDPTDMSRSQKARNTNPDNPLPEPVSSGSDPFVAGAAAAEDAATTLIGLR